MGAHAHTHDGAVVDAESLQRPRQAQAHQDVKHITADGVGDGHVSQTWGKESNAVKVWTQPHTSHLRHAVPTAERCVHVNMDPRLLCAWTTFICFFVLHEKDKQSYVRALPRHYDTSHAVGDTGACC